MSLKKNRLPSVVQLKRHGTTTSELMINKVTSRLSVLGKLADPDHGTSMSEGS